ncbi:MAG: hypothetical protein SynsKO_08720 [Synoicihabitans sp.]
MRFTFPAMILLAAVTPVTVCFAGGSKFQPGNDSGSVVVQKSTGLSKLTHVVQPGAQVFTVSKKSPNVQSASLLPTSRRPLTRLPSLTRSAQLRSNGASSVLRSATQVTSVSTVKVAQKRGFLGLFRKR